MVKKSIITAVICAAALLTGCAQAGAGKVSAAETPVPLPAVTAPDSAEIAAEAAPRRTITVTGIGNVKLAPDKAEINLGVTSEAVTAAEAQQKNSEAIDAVIEALTGAGVEEKDISTDNYNMYPKYDYNRDGAIIGYFVSNNLSVANQSIDDVGVLLSTAVNAGANEIGGVNYTCSTYDDAYGQAMTDAVASARAKAEALAAAAGVELGETAEITEGYQNTSSRYSNTRFNADAEAMKAMGTVEEAAMDMAVSVRPGEANIAAQVTVTYYIGE